MFRVTSLANMPEQQLNRWIKRIALLLFVVFIAFVAFYIFDRYNPIAPTPMVDRQIVAAEAAVQAKPEDIAARGALADLYISDKRYTDAVAQYDAIIATGKGEELARIGRARAYEALANTPAAITDWQRVVEIASAGEMAAIDPKLALAYYKLGTLSMGASDTKAAVDYLQKSLAISKTDADTLYALGNAYVATGENDGAIESYKRATAFVPVGWAEPYEGLAKAYTAKGDTALATWATAMASIANGDTATAEAQLKTLLGGTADLDASMGLGLAAETRGEGEQAIPYYQHVLDKDPSNEAAMLAMARVRPVAPEASPAASQEGQN
ncbi:MAG TPA: tetratricopeptide repeat protein [Candidatus Limnocylindrales bacterium]|jgi:tetratricopeptide (TPR) repeat protein